MTTFYVKIELFKWKKKTNYVYENLERQSHYKLKWLFIDELATS